MALASMKSMDGPDALFHNFSRSMSDSSELIVLFSSHRRYDAKELSSTSIALGLDLDFSSKFSTLISSYGYKDYRESQIRFSYARNLSNNASVSLGFAFIQLRIREYGSKTAPAFSLGFSKRINPYNNFSVYLANFGNIEVGYSGFTEATIVLNYSRRLNDSIVLLTEIEKSISQPVLGKLGIEYDLKSIVFRLAYDYSNALSSFGFGFDLKPGIHMDIAAQMDLLLGINYGLNIIYSRS